MIHRTELRAKRRTLLCGFLALAVAATSAIGCAGPPLDEMEADAIVEEGPLGGEALAQRKQDLNRAYHDMVHFHTTMQSLIDRHDGRSLATFDRFLDEYMGTHLSPMLRSEWQSSHPELMARDASLRFVQAEVLAMMRYPRRVEQVKDEIERRYETQGDLLVEYPIGKQGTLGRALELLNDRKWSGG